jgi:UDP-4-amino-4,6-dideoxy-N-acetyl-beta-L-altrosamine transaminase
MIPYGRQDVTQEDVDAVIEVLRSDFLTQGPAVPRFEQALQAYTGARHAVAVNSATSALHIACLALGLGAGDWLWTTPLTFVASANCALYCGAQVDFVDIDPRTWNMCPHALESKLLDAERRGRLPKIVVPVHLCGQPCDMAAIAALAQRFGFRVIEDASHAIGARYRSEPVGNCRHSDITVFSFHPVKIVTSGEGGAALTQDTGLAERMALLRSHGITRDPARMQRPPEGPWYYEQIALGFNYRLTDIQAALGASQLRRVDEYVRRRHALAERYDAQLGAWPLQLPLQVPDAYSALHLYVVRLQTAAIRPSHAEVFARLREAGIGVNLHYMPVHLQPYYARMGFRAGTLPEAERYYAQAITLPLFPTLDEADQDRVVAALRAAMR